MATLIRIAKCVWLLIGALYFSDIRKTTIVNFKTMTRRDVDSPVTEDDLAQEGL